MKKLSAIGFLSLACFVALLSPLASTASADCPSFSGVQAIKGTIGMSIAAGASGPDEEAGGMETITFGRHLSGLKVDLSFAGKNTNKETPGAAFLGSAKGGQVAISDIFQNTGTDIAGEATWDGPLPNNHGDMELEFLRKSCSYGMHFAFRAPFHFEGDIEANPHEIGGGVWARAKVPANLGPHVGLAGSVNAGVQADCDILEQDICAVMESGFLSEFIELSECGKLGDLGECSLDEKADIGKATFDWHLKPIYAKKK